MEPTAHPAGAFPPEVAFRHDWRPYQARVFADFADYLADRRIHVVAAPGSGKTILGLELVRRLNAPTLILAPTLTIRDQWVARLVSSFLPDGSPVPAWVSTDLRAPGLLTVATYQALHMACTGEAEPAEDEDDDTGDDIASPLLVDCPAVLHAAGIRTLVVDEAHHLRSAWWNTLQRVRETLDDLTIIALTATPPYDVPPTEWARYQELCGEVDVEVTAPELVIEGHLCPHQDYTYLSVPTVDERGRLAAFRTDVARCLEAIDADAAVIAAVRAHPWIIDPDAHLTAIYDNAAVLSSMVIFLTHHHLPVPAAALQTLGVDRRRIPARTLEWMEIFLNAALFSPDPDFVPLAAVLASAARELHRIGALERRTVTLRSNKRLARMLSMSASKLHSIGDIVALEHAALGDRLRLVVLADYIRQSAMPTSAEDAAPPQMLGVVPIFELLRRQAISGLRLGLICGPMVVIPATAEPRLRALAAARGIAPSAVHVTPLQHDAAYMQVTATGSAATYLVGLITDLFTDGSITALVGSTALLGEGWDAPCLNSLVLASFVGSFMLSNQMRGRAIRAEAGNPEKTANVWHLVCVEPDKDDPGDDYASLRRRFHAFMGLSETEDRIVTGLDRLDLTPRPFTVYNVPQLNNRTAARARDRQRLRDRWARSLADAGSESTVTDEVHAQEVLLPRQWVFVNTLFTLLMEAGVIAYYFFGEIFQAVARTEAMRTHPNTVLPIVAGIAAVVALPWAIKALVLFLRHGTLESSMLQVGRALLSAMCRAEIIRTPPLRLTVQAERSKYGPVICSLKGATARERMLFLQALQELMDPIDNPRYLLCRSALLWFLPQRDYHAVPQCLGVKQEWARAFLDAWQGYVGRAQLIYTRTPEGRAILLRARQGAMSTAFQPRAERRSCWK